MSFILFLQVFFLEENIEPESGLDLQNHRPIGGGFLFLSFYSPKLTHAIYPTHSTISSIARITIFQK